MSDTRYPTRMHEVLGVEVDEEFEIIDYPGVTFLVSGNGWMYVKWPSGRRQIAGQDYWASAINNGIIRKSLRRGQEEREDTLPTAEHSSGVEEPTVSKTEREGGHADEVY